MKEPSLDSRHRDKNGEISKKHGNTLVDTSARFTVQHSRRGSRATPDWRMC
jgi:hypothetical protein